MRIRDVQIGDLIRVRKPITVFLRKNDYNTRVLREDSILLVLEKTQIKWEPVLVPIEVNTITALMPQYVYKMFSYKVGGNIFVPVSCFSSCEVIPYDLP